MIHTQPHNRLIDLERLACAILPLNISIATGDPVAIEGGLLQQEENATHKMCAARKTEFICGRATARRAMAGLGHGADAIPMGRDRAPIWPEGIVGSITQSADACIALAAAGETYRSLGVDLEPDQPLADELVLEICRPEEKDWLYSQPAANRGHLARLLFSAKEAAYKAQYPLTKLLFGFDRFSVRFDFGAGGFLARFTQATGVFYNDQCLYGNFTVGHGIILTVVTLPVSAQEG